MAANSYVIHNLKHEEHTSWDAWEGTAEQLIAAGLAKREQFPGEPGNQKICCTYYQGVLVGKGRNKPHDENYLSIKLKRRNLFRVVIGLSAEQKHRRDVASGRYKPPPPRRQKGNYLLSIQECDRSYCHDRGEHWYEVSKADVQKAGVASGVIFPGEPGGRPRQVTVAGPAGSRVQINRSRGEEGKFDLYVEYSAQHVRSIEDGKKGQEIESKLASLAKSEAEFRDWSVQDVMVWSLLLEKNIKGQHERFLGYSFCPKVQSRVSDLLDEIRNLAETGHVTYSARDRTKAIAQKYTAAGLCVPDKYRDKDRTALKLVYERGEKSFKDIIDDMKSASAD